MRIAQAALFSVTLFLGVIACVRIGWHRGRARLSTGGEQAVAGLGALEGAVYALMGLLLAFTFTGAADRFQQRRGLIVEEVNAIGTAWQRLDLLDADTRADVRALLRQYLDARIQTYANVRDAAAVASALETSGELQDAIWIRVVSAAREDPTPRIASSLLPPVGEMFDIASTRTLATQQHPPLAIYLMLGFLVLVSSLLAGFGMAKSVSLSRLHVLGFAAIVSITIYLILDLEFPRLGLLRVDDFDQAFLQLRQLMQ